MAKNKQRKTAAQLLSELERNPEFRAEAEERNDARRKLEYELRIAESSLVRDLGEVGVYVSSVWDLVNSCDSYPRAIPILLAHLERTYPTMIREGIIRALTVPEARGVAAPRLVRAFREEANESVKWTIGNALAVVADEATTSDLIELAREPSHGNARQMLLLALRNINTERSRTALRELLADGELARLGANL